MILVTVLLVFGLEPEPMIAEDYVLSHQDVARAQQILERNDPTRFKEGHQQLLVFSEPELDLVARYLAERSGRGRMRAWLEPGRLGLLLSASLPIKPVDRYLNVKAVFREDPPFVALDSLHIGRLQVPRVVANALFRFGLRWGLDHDLHQLLRRMVRKVGIDEQQLSVQVAWTKEVLSAVRSRLISDDESERIILYQQSLGQLLEPKARGVGVPLFELIEAMMRQADRRAPAGRFVAENRAVILTLAAYLDHRSLAGLVPEIKGMPPLPERQVELLGRRDFARHFILSAALVMTGDATFVDLAGVSKEMDDIDHGSGFSFTDLAADRAGARFGELATSSERNARYVQKSFVRGLEESDLMPGVNGLPEFMDSETFSHRYGTLGSPAYRSVMDEIERRIAACRLYADAG